MDSDTTAIVAGKRDVMGTKAARRLRRQGQVPAIIYGQGDSNPSIALPTHEVEVAIARGAHLLTISIEGEDLKYLIKDVQYDYMGSTPIHLDLVKVDEHEVVVVSVLIELRGTPAGISDGGSLDQVMNDLAVRCKVADIPELIRPSVAKLGIGETLHVSDIELPEGVEAVSDGAEAVAVVRAPVEEEEEAEGEAEGEEGQAEPEVIGRDKKDEEEAED